MTTATLFWKVLFGALARLIFLSLFFWLVNWLDGTAPRLDEFEQGYLAGAVLAYIIYAIPFTRSRRVH